jgi:O-antigen ligase
VYRPEDALPILLLIALTIAAIRTPRGIDSLKYVAAYTYVFVGAYLLIKGAVANAVSTRVMLDAVLAGVVATAGVSTVEFILDLFWGVDLGAYLFRSREIDVLYGAIFPRSAAFSTEPGVLAFYIETLGLVGGWWAWRRFQSRILIAFTLTLIVAGWAATFSAASIGALLIGGTVAISLRILRSRNTLSSAALFLVAPFLAVVAVFIVNYARDTFLGTIILKITLQGDAVGSAGMRLQRWAEGLQTIVQHPIFGEGPGTASQRGEGSSISWYIFLAAEAGLISFIPAIGFIFCKFSRIISSLDKSSYIFVVAFTSGAVHLSVMSTFFHPFLWTLMIVFDVLDTRVKPTLETKIMGQSRSQVFP